MQHIELNIIGLEWVTIIFVILLLILGTNKLPEAAKKIGVLVGEYNKTKKDVQNKMNNFSDNKISIQGPVKNNRQKLETIAKSLNIDIRNKTDTELQKMIHTIIENKEKNDGS